MAKDLPEYKRQSGIQPAASPVGFAEAGVQANAGIAAIGRLGADIAKTAANERAQMSAIEGAKENPERQLLPAFTESDKVFNDTFRTEQYKILANRAKSFENQMNLEYSKIINPTMSDVASYSSTMNEFFGKVLSMSDPKNHADLERAFNEMTESGVYQLSGRAEDTRRRLLKESAQVSTQNNLQNILNYSRLGMLDAAGNAYADELKNIESTRVLFGEEATKSKIDTLNLTKDMGIYGSKLMDVQASQGTEAASRYLKEFVENKPEGMDATRHDVLSGELYKMYANYQKQIGQNQAIEASKANLELEMQEGILWPERWDDIKNKVSPQEYNALLVKSIHMQQAKNGVTDAINYTLQNGKDPIAMRNVKSSQLDKVFDEFMKVVETRAQDSGLEFDRILAAGEIAQNIAAPIKKVQEMLETAVNFSDPDSAAKAAAVIRMLKKNQPIALEGLDKGVMDVAALFDNYRRSTKFKDPIEALQQAQNDIYNVSDEEKQRRTDVFNKYWTDEKYDKDPQKWYKEVAKNLDIPSNYSFPFSFNYAMPSDLPVKAKSLLRSYVGRFGNMETAKQQMFEDMKMAYKETDTNNRNEVMELPPDYALKDINIGFWQDNDKTLALYRYIKSGQAMQRNPDSFLFNKVEWPNNPFDEHMKIDGKPIEFKADGTMTVDGKKITKQEFFNALPENIITQKMVEGDIKILVDGKERKVIIEADDYTSIPYNGLPSWKFSYLDENDVAQPIMGITQSGGQVRWYPNTEILDTLTRKLVQNEQDNANINAAIQKGLAQKIFEQRTNPVTKSSKYPKVIPQLYGEDLGVEEIVKGSKE